MTKLPAPEQWVLSKMSEMEVAEMIERHIDYVDDDGRSVHLLSPFVRHYMRRDDNALPTVVAITTLPIVLADGGLLAPDGLDRRRGIIFEIQKEIRTVIPAPQTAPKRRCDRRCNSSATIGCATSPPTTPASAPHRRGADYHRAVATR